MAGNFGGVVRGANQGFGRLAQALGGGNMAEQQAYDQSISAQSRIGQALAQMAAQRAAANAHDAQAAETQAKTSILAGRPAAMEEQVAAAAGSDVPTLRAWRQSLQTGRAPQIEMAGPATPEGGALMGDVQISPEQRTRLAQALQRFAPMATGTGDIKIDDWAKALGSYREQDLGDQVLAGKRTAGDVGRSQAAVKGSPLYHFDTSGLVGDLFGGGLNESSDRAQTVTGKERAQAGQADAAADASRASAALHRAQADEVKSGPKGQLVQTDQGPVFADPRSGSSVAVLGPDGKPAGAKLKDLPPAVAAKIMEGRQALSNLDNAIAAVQRNPHAFGAVNAVPGVEWMRQGDTEGVDARAQVANIGSLKLHDRSGAAVSASEFPRLAPFIPSSSDRPDAIIRKLQKMKEIAESELGLFADFYGPSQGFKEIPASTPKTAPATPSAAAPAPNDLAALAAAELARRQKTGSR